MDVFKPNIWGREGLLVSKRGTGLCLLMVSEMKRTFTNQNLKERTWFQMFDPSNTHVSVAYEWNGFMFKE